MEVEHQNPGLGEQREGDAIAGKPVRRKRSKPVRISLCEYLAEAGVPGGIVSLGRIPGPKPGVVSPARPERGRLMLGGRAKWYEDLAAWRPFEDRTVTHGLLLSNAFYSGPRDAARALGDLMAEADSVPQASAYPYPHHPFGATGLPRVLFFHRRHWPEVRRLFSRRRATSGSAYRNPPFAHCPWNRLPFIPSDIPEQCDGLMKSPWNPQIDRCVAIRRSNEARLVDWAMTVRTRAATDIVTLVGSDRLHGFLRAVRLWKFPAGTRVRVVCLDLPAADLEASGNWPEGYTFHPAKGKGEGFRDAMADQLALCGSVCASDCWIWLDPEAISVGLNRPASLFCGDEWEDADWGAPGSYVVNRLPCRPETSAPAGWPELETVFWLGEPATLLRGSFVARLLEAWRKSGEHGVFEEFASRFAREAGAKVRLANLHVSGWRML